jgi:DNA-binding NtrC family response regulator
MAETPTLLLVDDDETFRKVIAGELASRGFAVTTVAGVRAALAAFAVGEPDVMLLDLRLPDGDGLDVLRAVRERSARTEVLILTGHGAIDTAIEAIRRGAFDYVTKPCPLDELEIRLRKALERRALVRRNDVLEAALAPGEPDVRLVGRSAAHEETMRLLERAAPTDSAVLILGETGTGKEIVARLLHARSGRRDRAFVAVDCAGLHEELLQSELFGHEKGAFTGAVRAKPGLFEVADGGTIFLDEIGEMSVGTQVRLLRVLESSTFRRVGGTDEIRVDVRILAASNRDLASCAREGTFRDDLFWRLATIRIALAPLRERREDVRPLVEHFLGRGSAGPAPGVRVSDEVIEVLERHSWPGNVRELAHAVEHAVIVAGGAEIEVRHLPPWVRAPGTAAEPALPGALVPMAEMERLHIQRALQSTGGHRGRAAAILGISERNLYRKLREFGLG